MLFDFHYILGYIVEVVDIATVVVMMYGFAYSMVLLAQMHRDHRMGDQHKSIDLSVIRIKLWSYLLLALELFIVADVLLTIWDQSIEHLIGLWSIVVIRVVITHFLQKEMTELKNDGIHH